MKLTDILESNREPILSEAVHALERASFPSYQASETELNRSRISKLLDLTIEASRTKDLQPMLEHARKLAAERYKQGFGLAEIIGAFNVLEEAIWRCVTSKLEPAHFPEALGTASTILGMGKERLSVEYVAMAAQRPEIQDIDWNTVFEGI